MYYLILLVALISYAAIIAEHKLKINKAAPALFGGALIWGLIASPHGSHDPNLHGFLVEHLFDISGIFFFLLGAMTVVELMDRHGCFALITSVIKTRNVVALTCIVGISTFFLSAALDNLTTAIVMVAVLKKIITDNKRLLLMLAGLVVVAANAGGAWSPIGDVTTIMLWNSGQITGASVIKELFVPSIVCLIVGIAWALWHSRNQKASINTEINDKATVDDILKKKEKVAFLLLGLLTLLWVPLFKTWTHLPPFLGIFIGLGFMWLFSDHRHSDREERENLKVANLIRHIDTPTILFFLGILLTVSGLQFSGHLTRAAEFLTANLEGDFAINGAIGALSAIVDNVPLVAAIQGMYGLNAYPVDSTFWNALAYGAGTGGSMLIIGSAAGVAVMGLLKDMTFGWYLKHVAPGAALGYIGGFVTYYLMC